MKARAKIMLDGTIRDVPLSGFAFRIVKCRISLLSEVHLDRLGDPAQILVIAAQFENSFK
jgi:hypothetical protein